MKKKKIKESFLIIVTLLCYTSSCRSNDTDSQITGKNAVIQVNFAKDEYTDFVSNGEQASVRQNTVPGDYSAQKNEIPFGDFILITELKPEISSQRNMMLQAGLNSAAATVIQRAIKFRVVVYNAAGEYDSSYIYSIGANGSVTADSGKQMALDGGKNYTFVVYSYNTNIAPNENLAGSNLNTASVSFSSAQDLMYYSTSMIPSGEANAQNRLNVVLKHMLSSITVIVDSAPTNGYNITNISGATIGKSFGTATINLATGNVTSSGSTNNLAVSFPANPNTSVLQSAPILINNTSGINDGNFNINSITVGPLTQGPVTLLNNLRIQPGVRYSLTVRLVPQDIFIDDTTSVPGQTIKTVRINGKVWMRNNLGDNRTNVDLPPFNQSNYYQFGRSTIVANTGTQPGEIAGWNTSAAANNAWNSGTETIPVKTANDPCPNGYRIPTVRELQSLLDNTVHTQLGTTPPSDSNFDNAMVYTSKRNNAVKLTIPAIGARNGGAGRLNNRGLRSNLWTSTAVDNSTANANTTSGVTIHVKRTGDPVRCVAQ